MSQVKIAQIPAVIPGGLYTRKQLVANLGMSPATFAKWVTAGLQGVTEAGTKNELYFADDVLQFIATLKPKKGD